MDLEKLAKMAAAELARHGLAGWTFRLGATKRRLGVCKYRQKRIEIDAYYAAHNPEPAVRALGSDLSGRSARFGYSKNEPRPPSGEP